MKTIEDVIGQAVMVNLEQVGLESAELVMAEEIPIFITEEHNEVYYFWEQMGIADAVLIHVDAHTDLDYQIMCDNGSGNYFKKLDIGGFIAPAYHYGMFSGPFYWLNPHDESNSLQEFDLGTKIISKKYGKYITWDRESYRECENIHSGRGKPISKENIVTGYPLVVDIDLDAFSCSGIVHPISLNFGGANREGINGKWEKRVMGMVDVLRGLDRPTMITITRSQSSDRRSTYVNPRIVDTVQGRVIEELMELYRG